MAYRMIRARSRSRPRRIDATEKRAMRPVVLLSALIWIFALGQPAASATEPPAATSSLDHILLWGRGIDQVNRDFGGQTRVSGQARAESRGVANRYVRMSDGSYLELESITRPNADMDPGMRADQAMLRGGVGSRTFGLRSSALDQVRILLQRDGLSPTAIFSASPMDPDGGGPSKPPRWRLFAFERPPLSSNLFFIDYASVDVTPARMADNEIARTHPNSARELSAVWLLSSNADADRKQFERMGFTAERLSGFRKSRPGILGAGRPEAYLRASAGWPGGLPPTRCAKAALRYSASASVLPISIGQKDGSNADTKKSSRATRARWAIPSWHPRKTTSDF